MSTNVPHPINKRRKAVQDLPPDTKRLSNDVSFVRSIMPVSAVPTSEKACWYVQSEKGTAGYVTLDNRGELLIVDQEPNALFPYAPILFRLENGWRGGQYIIYTYGLVVDKTDELYALTVHNGRLQYGNRKGLDYDWCFIPSDGGIAIKFCGKTDDDRLYILKVDDDKKQICLQISTELEQKHYSHTFCTV